MTKIINLAGTFKIFLNKIFFFLVNEIAQIWKVVGDSIFGNKQRLYINKSNYRQESLVIVFQ